MIATETVSELIAEVCEQVILPRHGTLASGEVEAKRPGDLVTIADREAEAELTAALSAACPGALVVGEEQAFVTPEIVSGLAQAEHVWVIDPVDGTRNFAAASHDFGVMLAEVRHGETVRSWIWQPMYQVLYVAELGAGATRNGMPLPRLGAPEQPYSVGVWRSAADTPAPGVAWCRTRSSCAIDYPILAQGGLAGLAYRSVHPWDHLPGALLLAEVGGSVLVEGRHYRPGVSGRVLSAGADTEVARVVDAALRP